MRDAMRAQIVKFAWCLIWTKLWSADHKNNCEIFVPPKTRQPTSQLCSTLQKPFQSIIYSNKWSRNFSSNCEHAFFKEWKLYIVYIAANFEYTIHKILSTFVELLWFFVESSDDKFGTEKAEEYVNTSFMK